MHEILLRVNGGLNNGAIAEIQARSREYFL